ncbi:MAG: protein-methionine-sulfoxide reductase heme-binding subunit MsrQ [Rhodobacteraceae bacterium]|nr:protein-methionine-sulfoxide reductase heme-binding subunit MsrQ [Paracoccaceae bacterium]
MTLAQEINGRLRKAPAWPIYIVFTLPGLWWFYLGATGGLGAEPIKALEHAYGKFALQLLIAGLLVTPLRAYAGVNLLKFRRAIGLMAFFYVLAHLLVWLVLDVQAIDRIWADIVKRPYITVGMMGFALLLPLAVTSNDRVIRRMGGMAWRKLHRLVYPAVILGGLHYVMLVKGWQLEPLIYLAAILTILAVRIRWKQRFLPA